MYVTLDEYRAYAVEHGHEVPEDDQEANVQLVRASQFIDSKEAQLIGRRTDRDQPHAYPRDGLRIDGFTYDSEEIPSLVKNCQMELALEINSGIDLYAPSDVLPVVKERVEGAVEVGYASPAKVEAKRRESTAMNMLRRLMRAPSMSIPIVRV